MTSGALVPPQKMEEARPDEETRAKRANGPSTAQLAVAALGVVFGDIGTSPIYAFRQCVAGEHGVHPDRENVLGVLSLVSWSLMLVVTVKYLVFILRADNHGEGGILALLALVPEKRRKRSSRSRWVVLAVIAGTALLFGDGMITPAISVLSAVEGLATTEPGLGRYVVPITCIILLALFMIQRRGTTSVGGMFGPIIVLWFITIGGLGLWHLLDDPSVLAALDPRHAISFFARNRLHGFAVLGAVVLAVTGAEALYADIGHFGTKPIRIVWLGLVFPCLLLAYFGQGARVAADPSVAKNPFFGMAPGGWGTYALVGIATAATIIASQAMISGSFSLAQQAVQLGYFPRVLVAHTSRKYVGQIYVPAINRLLAVACVLLVIAFGSSAKLAAAYGIAVTGTMAITSLAYFVVTRERWRWSLGRAVPLLVGFLVLDLAFFGANVEKIPSGGWVPLAIAAVFFTTMMVWNHGSRLVAELKSRQMRPDEELLAALRGDAAAVEGQRPISLCARTPGTGIFLTSHVHGAPATLVRFVEHARVLPEKVVLVTVETVEIPVVQREHRAEVKEIGDGLVRILGRYGYMEMPDIPRLLADAEAQHGLHIGLDEATYFLGRETILGAKGGRMGRLEESLFGLLARNAPQLGRYFKLPPEQVMEIGFQVNL